MNPSQTINETLYPIQTIWIIKYSLIISLLIFIYSLFREGLVFASILFFISFSIFTLIYYLKKKYFHFSLDERYITLKQGIISKQQRQLPYGVIQEVSVSRGLLDMLIGLTNLNFQNASEGAGQALAKQSRRKAFSFSAIGFASNSVNIPGLKKADAENLKNAILEKIKLNPIIEQGL